MGIVALDQIDLPLTQSFLHGFFALDGGPDLTEILEPDQHVYFVVAREPHNRTRLVLCDARNKIARHSDVECAPRSTGEHVN